LSTVTSSHSPSAAGSLSDATRVWPVERLVGRASALKVGMWIFLISDALTFGGLLLAYAVLRAGARQWWPSDEPELGIKFTAGLTFLLICSSVSMVLAVGAAHEGRRTATVRCLALTAAGGVLFLVGQAHEYFGIPGPGLIARGLVFGHSARATTFFLITSFHGLHVLTGVIILLVVLGRARWGWPAAVDADVVEAAGLFWHFVDLIWILVFTFVYLIPT
jgi:cytochrome c oxidase subunit 3